MSIPEYPINKELPGIITQLDDDLTEILAEYSDERKRLREIAISRGISLKMLLEESGTESAVDLSDLITRMIRIYGQASNISRLLRDK